MMSSKTDDPRLATLINVEKKNPAQKVAIIGYACDLGVERNGGRIGSKSGPEIFRQYLPKIGSVVNPEFEAGLDISKIQIKDLGDVRVGESDSLEDVHKKLRLKVKQALDDHYIPFVVGGGNDQSYPNARALMDHLGNGDVAVINVDAHLDVRPLLPGNLAHSGSPFRLLLEDNDFSKIFVEFGCQGAVCGAAHAQYVSSKGGRLLWLSKLRSKTSVAGQFAECLASFGDRPIFVSFDVDSVQSADCPGVSAPAAVGLTGQEALDICREAGKNRRVRLFDMSEFNPRIESDRTARLLCHMFYYFLLGLAERAS